MSDVKLMMLKPDLVNNKCNIAFQLPSKAAVHIHGLTCNPPGDQKESELRKLAIEAAISALKEVIDNPPA